MGTFFSDRWNWEICGVVGIREELNFMGKLEEIIWVYFKIFYGWKKSAKR